jgi:hypothetical protein
MLIASRSGKDDGIHRLGGGAGGGWRNGSGGDSALGLVRGCPYRRRGRPVAGGGKGAAALAASNFERCMAGAHACCRLCSEPWRLIRRGPCGCRSADGHKGSMSSPTSQLLPGRSTPELQRVQAELGVRHSFREASRLLSNLLPSSPPTHATLRNRLHQAAMDLKVEEAVTLLFHALRREELCKLKVRDFRHARKGVPHLRISCKGGNAPCLPTASLRPSAHRRLSRRSEARR